MKFYNDCNRDVAILCNHKRTVAKGLTDQLEKMNELIKEKQKEVTALEAWAKKLKKDKNAENKDGLPKTVEATNTKIQKLKEQIKTKEFDKQNKEDNAEVALGTSKINYMDPRITISWCKRQEVPIERAFPKALRSKFAWAMDNDPDWQF